MYKRACPQHLRQQLQLAKNRGPCLSSPRGDSLDQLHLLLLVTCANVYCDADGDRSLGLSAPGAALHKLLLEHLAAAWCVHCALIEPLVDDIFCRALAMQLLCGQP